MTKPSCLLVLYLCLNLLQWISATTTVLPVSTLSDHPQQSTFSPASTYMQDSPRVWLMGLLNEAFVSDLVNWRPSLPHQSSSISQRIVHEHYPLPDLEERTHTILDCVMNQETRHGGHERQYLRGIPSRIVKVHSLKKIASTLLSNSLSHTIDQSSGLECKPRDPHLQQPVSIIEKAPPTPGGSVPTIPTPKLQLQHPPSIIETPSRPTPGGPVPPSPTPQLQLQHPPSTIEVARSTPSGPVPTIPTPRLQLQHPPSIIETPRPTPGGPVPPSPTPHLQLQHPPSIIEMSRPTPDPPVPTTPTPRQQLQHPERTIPRKHIS